MAINIIGHTKDLRTDSNVIYAFITINDYLDLVGEEFDTFSIQRKQEKHKAYERMREDIKKGAVLPPITLAVKPDYVDSITMTLEQDLKKVEALLNNPNQLFILDGLQRTHILYDLSRTGTVFNENQKLLLEIWVEKEVKHLIYRLIILNAGRKVMSLRHQLELLYSTISGALEKDFKNLTLSREADKQRRRSSNFYKLAYVITSYHCFLTKNYEPKKENLITQQMIDENVIYATEDELNIQFDLFKKYFGWYLKMDEATFNHYPYEAADSDLEDADKDWWSHENVMNAFFAALADYGNNNPIKRERIELALDTLIKSFELASNQDVLGFKEFKVLKYSINSNKKNIGLATKRLLFEGFREYFINKGEKPLADCWKFNTH